MHDCLCYVKPAFRPMCIVAAINSDERPLEGAIVKQIKVHY